MRRLEEFSFQASLLARWWDWVILEMTPGPPGPSHFEVDFVDLLQQPSVLQRWRQLNAQFAQYTDVVSTLSVVQGSSLRSLQVREIQDAYPSLWETPVRSDGDSIVEIRTRSGYSHRRESPSRSMETMEGMKGCCTIM